MLKKTDPALIQGFLEDSSGLLGGFAEAVVFPETEAEISEFLKDVSQKRIPVTISGGGTGVTGGRIPFGGVVLATDRLNKILKITSEYAIVQPAVRLDELQNEVGKINRIYLPEPTEPNAYLGGTVATNASGARGFKYGSTRKYVRRLKVVLSSGKVIEIKRGEIFADKEGNLKLEDLKFKIPGYQMPKIKNAAGYYSKEGMDLIDLFIGQEGTLGVVTEIELALGPKKETFDCIAFFPAEEDTLKFISEAKKQDALSLEYFDFNSLELLRQKYPNIPDNAKGAILFEQETTPETEGQLIENWSNLLEKFGVSLDKVWFAEDEKKKQYFKEFRHALPEMVNEIVKRNKMPKVGTDMAVPQDKFREMYNFYKEKLSESQIRYVIFGHIGENHLHANLLPESSVEFDRAKNIYLELVKKAISLGGTASAEHGIGKLKHAYLEVMYGRHGLEEMARVKKLLDPACILGLGNIFPMELLHL